MDELALPRNDVAHPVDGTSKGKVKNTLKNLLLVVWEICTNLYREEFVDLALICKAACEGLGINFDQVGLLHLYLL